MFASSYFASVPDRVGDTNEWHPGGNKNMKKLILKVKELGGGGFWSNRFLVLNVVKVEDGVESDMGDYAIMNSVNKHAFFDKRDAWKKEGYELVGNWWF